MIPFNRIFPSKYFALFEGILGIVGIWIFASFIHKDSLLQIISFTGLVFTAVVISRSVKNFASLLTVFGIIPFNRRVLIYSTGGIVFGIFLGLLYNYLHEDYFFPSALTTFAIIASLTGITEELVFRGFVQTKTATSGALLSIIIASTGHTFYKYLVIRTLPVDLPINFWVLILLTFVVGIILGILRERSESVLPPAFAHGIFDIVVYGGLTTAPVWVWG